jgi:hypothetical protein
LRDQSVISRVVRVAAGVFAPGHLGELTQVVPFELAETGRAQHRLRELPSRGCPGPGGYIAKPRGEVHTMWNAGQTPARMIEVITPAGFENFFHALAEIVAAGPPEPAAMVKLSDEYGLQLHQPEWMDDLIARYGLRNPLG